LEGPSHNISCRGAKEGVVSLNVGRGVEEEEQNLCTLAFGIEERLIFLLQVEEVKEGHILTYICRLVHIFNIPDIKKYEEQK